VGIHGGWCCGSECHKREGGRWLGGRLFWNKQRPIFVEKSMIKSEGKKKLGERKRIEWMKLSWSCGNPTESGGLSITRGFEREREKVIGVYPVLVSYTRYCTGNSIGLPS
jgi:hypothetical protein